MEKDQQRIFGRVAFIFGKAVDKDLFCFKP